MERTEQWLEERCLEVENIEKSQNPQNFSRKYEICATLSPRLPRVKDNNGNLLDRYQKYYNESVGMNFQEVMDMSIWRTS